MKKLLLSVLTIGIVGTAAYVGYSRAFFTDTETSYDNTFQAGELTLLIDSEQHYNGNVCTETEPGVYQWVGKSTYPIPGTPCTGTWPLRSLTNERFFDFDDVKPGDWGENTISIHVVDNDAWACVDVSPLRTNGPSGEALAAGLEFFAWADLDCDNIFDPGEGQEVPLFTNNIGPASDVLNGRTYTLADSRGGVPIPGGPLEDTEKTQCIGLVWCAGTLSVDPETGATECDGSTLGNAAQGGWVQGDIALRIIQARNNPNFVCSQQQQEEPTEKSLVLENETIVQDGDWIPKLGDGIGGLLTWTGDGPTFNYTLTAEGLPENTSYSLIYYADPYPGNYPGALIGTGMTDASGDLALSDNKDLGIDLPTAPDQNIGLHGGAKIWLIPSVNYDPVTKSVSTWAPDDTWLFEGNVYINYIDTDKL